MRTSRLAQDTARLASALAPRRLTRALTKASTPVKLEGDNDAAQTPDPLSNGVSNTRKRKRPRTPEDTRLTAYKSDETETLRVSPRTSASSKPKKARRQPAKKVKTEDGEVAIEPPANWEMVYNLTKEMRAEVLAPVDTMGCESLAEDQRTPRDRRFQTLIALMLSSQTKDTVTAVAIKNLQENLSGGLTLEAIEDVEPAKLNDLISKVGFHNNKTRFIKAVAPILKEQHNGDIPDTIDGMIALPGVGPKMAYLCMSAAWGRDEGIGVDVHVHRITNLWGWHKTNTPEETRTALEAWLPKEKWHDINHLLVGFGQTWCPPVGRRCDECKLAAQSLCPSAVVGRASKTKLKTKKTVEKNEEGQGVKKEEASLETDVKEVKAEDLFDAAGIQDIEDIGAAKRPRRGKR
ncbi:MAG: DNA N-glycosylase and apurinic/apyrimidinic (AP) lyase [Chrysothrix sp. TS-e1954]|nr:MAG: DNA N-glycosylase and apurinic/apyrimidinic (AP) lyase [Chrysothrix sp. TS-e1954]